MNTQFKSGVILIFAAFCSMTAQAAQAELRPFGGEIQLCVSGSKARLEAVSLSEWARKGLKFPKTETSFESELERAFARLQVMSPELARRTQTAYEKLRQVPVQELKAGTLPPTNAGIEYLDAGCILIGVAQQSVVGGFYGSPTRLEINPAHLSRLSPRSLVAFWLQESVQAAMLEFRRTDSEAKRISNAWLSQVYWQTPEPFRAVVAWALAEDAPPRAQGIMEEITSGAAYRLLKERNISFFDESIPHDFLNPSPIVTWPSYVNIDSPSAREETLGKTQCQATAIRIKRRISESLAGTVSSEREKLIQAFNLSFLEVQPSIFPDSRVMHSRSGQLISLCGLGMEQILPAGTEAPFRLNSRTQKMRIRDRQECLKKSEDFAQAPGLIGARVDHDSGESGALFSNPSSCQVTTFEVQTLSKAQ